MLTKRTRAGLDFSISWPAKWAARLQPPRGAAWAGGGHLADRSQKEVVG